jgi:integrase/recombinase XerD
MFTTLSIPKYLTESQETIFLSQIAINPNVSMKYNLIALLQADCGLRITETVSLQIKNFVWAKKEIVVKSLKKRKETWRNIPLSRRVINACAEYFQSIKSQNPDDYIFASESKKGHLCRKQVWKYFKVKSNGLVNPHMLRHTAATKLIEGGANMVTVKELLGHSSTVTTEIYTHASEERKQQAIDSIDRVSLPMRILSKFYPSVLKPKTVYVQPMVEGQTKYHVGREQEIQRLIELSDKRVNVLITGQQGIGKSHLMDNFNPEKVLRIDDTSRFRVTLLGMLLHLMKGDKEEIARLLDLNEDVVTKGSSKRLCNLLCEITEPKEYTILIDKADDVTPSVIKCLEDLRHHFHFIVCARSIPMKFATWLTNFEKLQIKPLNRSEGIELINRLTVGFRDKIENYEAFKNHVWNDCGGVPQFIMESVERYRKEGFISNHVVSNYHHTAAEKDFDASALILFAFAALVLIKYVGNEVDHDDAGAFKLVGGVAMVVALFSRQLFKAAKRRYV